MVQRTALLTGLWVAGSLGCAATAQSTKPFLDAGSVHITGRLRAVNGVTQVPVGLFGVHATKLDDQRIADLGIEAVRYIDQNPSTRPAVAGQGRTPKGLKMIVECFFDRYQPALVLTDRNWKDRLERLARDYARNAAATGLTHHVEFWNEPFLNWATRPGVNYDAAFYEQAGQEIGKPMTIKGWDKPLEHLVWSRELRLVDPNSGRVHYLANGDPPLPRKGLKAGDMYDFRGKQFRMAELWWGKDTSQTNYYSGKQNSQFYRWMLVPFARAMKQTNPTVQVVGGWGFSIASDGWRAWETLFKPTIDDCFVDVDGQRQLLLDGIGEHHYGGDTRNVAATYEIAYAYAMGEYAKKLKFYNTEAGGMLDPQRPDTGRPTFSGGGVDEWRGMFSYFVRDITYMINRCPDKAVARAAHSIDGNMGDQAGFAFLKPLRGKLLQTEESAQRVWSAASLNGDKLVAVVYNDNSAPATVQVSIDPPPGMSITSVDCSRIIIDNGKLTPSGSGQAWNRSAQRWAGAVNLEAKMPVAVVATLEGQAKGAAVATETQHVAKGILNKVTADKPLELNVAIPAEVVAAAKGAFLKLALEGWRDDTCSLRVNGLEMALDAEGGITLARIEPSLLRLENKLAFSCRGSATLGVQTASIVTVSHD